MRYKLLGKSGLRVSELALGTMTFGEEWGWGASKQVCQQIFEAYANAGGNFIDTANRYTEGTAEKFVGEFVASDRDHFVVTTKYTLFTRRDDPNAAGNHRKNMMHSLHASLKRLNTDYIDLYWVHAWDFVTPVEEIMRALDDLVRAGKVLYVGVSDAPAWAIARANTLAELRGWLPFVGLQIPYSLVQRDGERELLPMARALDIGVAAFSVLGNGVLSGKFNQGSASEKDRGALWSSVDDRRLAIAAKVIKVADEIDCTPSQVAVNWVRQQPGVVIPIIGARTLAQAQDNLKCVEFTLNDAHMKQLDDASKIELGFPHDFLASDEIRDLVFGGTYDKIDNYRK